MLRPIPLTALTATSLNAGVVPGRWEKVDALQQGEPITVTLKAGDLINATFVHLSPEILTISTCTDSHTKVPRHEVSRVEVKVDDGVKKGVLLGAAIGFAGPLIVTFASGVDNTEYPLGLGIGLIGATAGGLIDWRVARLIGETKSCTWLASGNPNCRTSLHSRDLSGSFQQQDRR